MPEDEESSDEEIVKPPERRAPSGRAGRGNRMQALMADELEAKEDEEEEEEADKSFYTQDFWADEEEDDDFGGDADDEEARDSFDSDFGDSTDSDDDDDDDEAATKKKAPAKKSSAYRDPKVAHKKGEGPSSSGGPPPKKPPVHKKRPRASIGEDGVILPPAERSKKSFRSSTQASTVEAEENRKKLEAAVKARAEKAKAAGAKRGVELVRLTQEEILIEAQQTEIINRASLERMLRIEEEKRRETVRERKVDGPRVKWNSTRNGDSVYSMVSFVDHPIPKTIDGIAPPYAAPLRCAVTGAPAKYRDPQTGMPYATLEAFRTLRGRTGRRQQHSFGSGGGGGPSAAHGGGDE